MGVLFAVFLISHFGAKSNGVLNYSTDISQIKADNAADYAKELLVNKDDISLGAKDAKITIIAYDSFSCVHCAFFYENVFPLIKSNYIDTGKARFIHRNFPFDIRALSASKLLKCYALNNTNNEVFNIIFGIYQVQKEWIDSDSYIEILSNIFEFAGMDKKYIGECLKDEELENRILEGRLKATKMLKINATPTFFINGEKLQRDHSFKNFSTEIDKILAN